MHGLTETSSTMALLGPSHHRAALGCSDRVVRARLASAGRPLPSVEFSTRNPLGNAGDPGVDKPVRIHMCVDFPTTRRASFFGAPCAASCAG
jgi:hypothetical protein